ncbi:MAG: EAL domain-containing protein [Lachnospiraceae bacterium]|nr:EAL domain-containing protein [Lachnospiraceae bacterium]
MVGKAGLLIIEKEGIDRQVLKSMLDMDNRVYETDSLKEASDIIKNYAIDIVIIDVCDSLTDSKVFINYIKESPELRKIAIIAVSNNADLDYELMRYGVNYNINRPYDPNIVKYTVKCIYETFIDSTNRLARQRDEERKKYISLSEAIPGGHIIVIKSDKYRLEAVNSKALKMLKYDSFNPESTDDDIFNYIAQEDHEEIKNAFEKKALLGSVVKIKVNLLQGNGLFRLYDLSIKSILLENGFRQYDIILVREPSKIEKEEVLKKELSKFQRRSMLDPLTRVLNKEFFFSETLKLINSNAEESFIIGVWNIDRFKAVNELFGSKVGDRLICEFAELLLDKFRAGMSTVGRLESDHFAICVTVSEWEKNEDEFDRILKGDIKWNTLNYSVFLHVGLYRVEKEDRDIAVMCDRANMALGGIKDSFVIRKSYFTAAMRDAIVIEQRIMRDAQKAIENNEFFIMYQPIVDVQTKEIVSAEALVRWRKSDGSFVSPGEFIPTFEKNGFVSALDSYVWERVCRFQYNRKLQGKNIVPISVNFSRMDFYNPNLYEDIIKITEQYGLNSDCLKIEITESAYMDQPQELINVIQRFKDDGYKVLMDDFGSGFSSLNMLKDMSVDVLKIDMRFMDSLDTSDKAGNILYSIIQMAKAIHMEVIAEGVETENQYDMLLSMDCDRIQGFYFYRPLPEEEFIEKLDENRKEMSSAGLKGYVKIILLTKTGEAAEDIIEALDNECELILLDSAEEVMDYMKYQFANVSMIVIDFTESMDEGRLLLEKSVGKKFFTEVPMVALVSGYDGAWEDIYHHREIKDVLRLPYSKKLLGKRIRNIIELAEIETEKRAVSILRKNILMRQQITSFFDDSRAGFMRLKLALSSEIKVNEVVYVNDSLLRILDTTLDKITDSDIKTEMLSSLRLPSRKRFSASVRNALMGHQTDFREELELERYNGDLENISVLCYFKYFVSEIIMDVIVIEETTESSCGLSQLLLKALDDILGAEYEEIWRYYAEEDIAEYFHKGSDNVFGRHIIHGAWEYLKSGLRLKDGEEDKLEGARESLLLGDDRISIRINCFNTEPYFMDSAELIFLRAGSSDRDSLIYLVILKNISKEINLSRQNWRAKQYERLLTNNNGGFAEFDLTDNKCLERKGNYALVLRNNTDYATYDAYLEAFLNSIDEDEARRVEGILLRQMLINSFEKGASCVKIPFMYMDEEKVIYNWYVCNVIMGEDTDGHLICSFNINSMEQENFGDTEEMKLMERDSLTGLTNRRILEMSVNKFLSKNNRTGHCCFFILDVDNFKKVNDIFGHDVGDSILRTISEVIRNRFVGNEIVSRLGGDEFGVFIPEIPDREYLEKILLDICMDAEIVLNNMGKKIVVSCSVGAVIINELEDDFRHIYPIADRALDIAKENGKNGYFIS